MTTPTHTASAKATRPIRLVLVDDHRMFRSGVKAELDPAVTEVVGEAPDVDTAVKVIKEMRPDVVLLDVHLPGGNGNGGVDVLSATRGATNEAGQPVRFLALSVSDAAEDVIAVIRAGARGYVTKTISGNDLMTAVRRVADGDAVFSPRLAGFVLDAFGAAAGEIAEVDEELDRLSAREREVMRLIARGYQYKEVAKETHLDQDRRDPRVVGAPQAPAVVAARADRVGDGSPPALSALPAGDDHPGHHLDAPLPHDDRHRPIEPFAGGGGDAGTTEDAVRLLGQLVPGDPHGVLRDRRHGVTDLPERHVVQRTLLRRTGGASKASPAQRIPRVRPDETFLRVAPEVGRYRPVDLGHAVVEDPAQPVCVRDQLREPGRADRTFRLDDVADHGLDLGHATDRPVTSRGRSGDR